MPLQKLQFRPGLNREGTDYANEGGFYDGDKIRFRSGFPEKIGGWTQASSNQFLGLARSLWFWVDLSYNQYIGVGTNLKYYINYGGLYYDITPIYHKSLITSLNSVVSSVANTTIGNASIVLNGVIGTGSVTSVTVGSPSGTTVGAVTITTVINSPTVTIVDTTYHPDVGDYVIITSSTAVNGVQFTGGEYVVTSIPTSNSFTITFATNATGSGSGTGGTVYIQYELPVGLNVYIPNGGWGNSPYGFGGWGSNYPFSLGGQLRLWSSDNYGQDLFMAPRGGPVYYWMPDGTYPNSTAAGLNTRAQSLQTQSTAAGYSGTYVPNTTYQVLTSSIQQFIICLGSNSYVSGTPNTVFNPMLVRWSDQANPYQWVPNITNQSGEFALTNGSYIMGARATRQEILVWTDSCLYSMQYLGAPYVWSFQVLMDNISVISPNSMVTVNNITYWMGKEKFYMYSGRVETLPCSLRQYIFADINQSQSYQIFAGSNEAYNEVWWFYCSRNSTTIDKYVIYNYLDRVWYYGSMNRTAWLDTGILDYPLASDYNSRLLYHENGNDDVSTGTAVAINAYVQSSDFDIGDGHNFGFVWRILPDVNFNGSSCNQPKVTMTVKPRQNSGTAYGQADTPSVVSGQNYIVIPEYTTQLFSGQVYTRLRGRQMSFRIESNTIGVAWQLGSPRIDIRPDGRR